jgi:hypothetical protein
VDPNNCLGADRQTYAIAQVADRIDGKATAETLTEQMHRYVVTLKDRGTAEEQRRGDGQK